MRQAEGGQAGSFPRDPKLATGRLSGVLDERCAQTDRPAVVQRGPDQEVAGGCRALGMGEELLGHGWPPGLGRVCEGDKGGLHDCCGYLSLTRLRLRLRRPGWEQTQV